MNEEVADAEVTAIAKRPDMTTAKRTDFTPEQIGLIQRTICPGASPDELTMFLGQCKRAGLDPLAKQIYLVKRNGKMAIQVGIDGYRLIADRTGLYAGNDDPVFDDEANPRKAMVTVWKMVQGQRVPFTASARWDQYYPGQQQGFMWTKMPHLMLGKCAEGLAMRKAFPMELSGLYIAEEMEQAGIPDAGTGPAHATKETGDCISEKEAANLAEIIMKLRQTNPLFVSKFVIWLGGTTKSPATLDDLQTIPKAKYAQGLQHLQKLEQDFDRKAAGS